MILAILQARMSSSRLPGKVLKPLCGKPMLLMQVERIKRARQIDRLLIATSVDPDDDAIEKFCDDYDLNCFRGSLEDVLDRFYLAAKELNPDHLVRLTGDCPLTDPDVIDGIIQLHREGCYDYTSNGIKRTFPDGLDAEVFTFKALEEAWAEAFLPSHREHVTPFIHGNPQRYKLGNYAGDIDLTSLRWTVDEELDYKLVSRIYEALYPGNPLFTTQDILDLLEKEPELKTMNIMYKCNEGMVKSLKEDALYLEKIKKERLE